MRPEIVRRIAERKRAKGAPPDEPGADAAEPLPAPWGDRLVTVEPSWTRDAPPPREYLARDVRTTRGAIPARGVALLVAAGGAGKSYASIALAVAVATGTTWLGAMHPTRPGRVLIVSAEEPAIEIRTRIYHVTRALGIASIPDRAIDVIDVHDAHVPLLDADASPTEAATALAELARQRGPYALTIVDPLARISGASIDGDNVAACALVTALEAVATAAGGLVLGVHHTSQTARRAGITDATAIRGATGLGDSARMVMVLTAETVEHEDRAVAERLGEIVSITRAKANHVGRWDPIQARRGEHGVLLALDEVDRGMVTAARRGADPRVQRRAARDDAKAEKRAKADAAVMAVVSARRDLGHRDLRAAVEATIGGLSHDGADAAIGRAVVDGRVVRSGTRSTGFRYRLPGGET